MKPSDLDSYTRMPPKSSRRLVCIDPKELATLRAERDAAIAERDALEELLRDVMYICSYQKEPWDSTEWVAASVKLTALDASAGEGE